MDQALLGQHIQRAGHAPLRSRQCHPNRKGSTTGACLDFASRLIEAQTTVSTRIGRIGHDEE
jgi:hypothetical protein